MGSQDWLEGLKAKPVLGGKVPTNLSYFRFA